MLQRQSSITSITIRQDQRPHPRTCITRGSVSEYGSLLIPIIMSKLPNDIRLQISRRATSEVWKINDLLDVIKTEVEARESSDRIKATDIQAKKTSPIQPTTSAFMTNNASDNHKGHQQIRCAYCNELHYSASCGKITDPNKRREILKKSQRCFNCLKTGHRLFECKNKKNCRHCQKRHHQSICNNKATESPVTFEPDTEESKTVTTTSNSVKRKGTVLL